MGVETPFATVQKIAGGYIVSRCLHAVADLGVADAMDEAPRTAAELAATSGVHPDALGRVLRLLAAHGVFEAQGDRFRHNPASRLLRTESRPSLRDLVRMLGNAPNWACFAALEQSLRTGAPAAERVLPGGYWAHYASHPDDARIFNAAMAGKAYGHVAALVASYDFSRFETMADIGGGSGHLLRGVLEATPRARGVLFDLPHVITQSAGTPTDRLRLQPGDFFKDALPACDAYLLMEVIHDWPDAESVAILQAIRRAAPAGARLLVIEAIVPDDPGPHWSKALDVLMLALLGGRQRTRREYEALLKTAGFRVEREIDTGADISILDAVAV
jgi:O-methyltransferase